MTIQPSIKSGKYIPLILISLFAALQISLPFQRPELDLSRSLISDYGVGRSALIFSLSLICLAIAKIFLIQRITVTGTISNKISRIGLLISAIATLFVATFPTDVGYKQTLVGSIHNTSAITVFTATAIFFIALAYNFKDRTSSKIRFFIAFINTLILAILGISGVETKGLAERAMMCSITLGLFYYALYLKKKI